MSELIPIPHTGNSVEDFFAEVLFEMITDKVKEKAASCELTAESNKTKVYGKSTATNRTNQLPALAG